MAIRYRKGRASPWQCYWNNPLTGKRECANFGTQHEAEKHDSLIKHRIKFDRESFRKDEKESEEPQTITLEACYLLYLREKQFSKKSLLWQMDSMRRPLEQFGMIPIADISREHITKVMDDMTKTGVKPVTVRKRLSVLKTVFRWCAGNGYCSMPDFPKLPSGHYEKFIPPTPGEIAAILSVASPHIARAVVLGAQLGVRVGPCELLQLTWDDVDLEQRILRVHGARKNLQALWREVPIRESLLPIFTNWKIQDMRDGAQHIIHYRGKPVQSLKTAWRAALRRAEITRNIRPYDLRHAFGTEMIAAGVDVGTVAKLMGHSTPIMLLSHYQYVMDRQKRAAVESLPDIGHVPNSMCPIEKAPTE